MFRQPPAFVVTASGGGKAVRSPPVSEDCDRDSTSRVHSFHNTQVLTVQLVHRQHPPPPLPLTKKKKIQYESTAVSPVPEVQVSVARGVVSKDTYTSLVLRSCPRTLLVSLVRAVTVNHEHEHEQHGYERSGARAPRAGSRAWPGSATSGSILLISVFFLLQETYSLHGPAGLPHTRAQQAPAATQ